MVMTTEKALTRDAAYAVIAERPEDEVRGEFCIAGSRYLVCSPVEILSTEVLATVVDGQVSHGGL